MSSSSASPEVKAQVTTEQIDERYRCGSLQYTKISLFVLFSWMIWGNICFNLFESMGGPTILGLYLQDNFHVSNLTVNILFNVIPMAIGTVMTPIISFKSDRTRTRFGRRIPYIMFTAPFLVFFAASIGFSDDIIGYCKASFPETALINPFTAALVVIGFLTIGFSFFNEFVGTVYYYLLPDVMPRHFLGRFQGVSSMVGTFTGIATNLWIVPYQLTHLKAIHVGIATLYFVGFGLVCWRVKEGQYPPVEDVSEKTTKRDQIRLYFRECFVHPIFILFYLSTACMVLTKGLNPAGIFSLHLSEHRGKISAYADAADAAVPAPGETGVGQHTMAVAEMDMAMTPDGKRLVTAGKDGQVKFWDYTAKKPALVKTAPDRRWRRAGCRHHRRRQYGGYRVAWRGYSDLGHHGWLLPPSPG